MELFIIKSTSCFVIHLNCPMLYYSFPSNSLSMFSSICFARCPIPQVLWKRVWKCYLIISNLGNTIAFIKLFRFQLWQLLIEITSYLIRPIIKQVMLGHQGHWPSSSYFRLANKTLMNSMWFSFCNFLRQIFCNVATSSCSLLTCAPPLYNRFMLMQWYKAVS